jgi:hypothetical protein
MAIVGLWVDSRQDDLTSRSGARAPGAWHGFAALFSAWLARACPPRGWLARRLR